MSFTKLVYCLVLCVTFSASVWADDLEDKYNQMMEKVPSEQQTSVPTAEGFSNDFDKTIQEINNLEKGIFESTPEFKERRQAAIDSLNVQVQGTAKKGTLSYQIGTLTMTDYDADIEILTGDLAYRKEVLALLPELNQFKSANMPIPRTKAKEGFAEQKTHPIFATVGWYSDRIGYKDVLLPVSGYNYGILIPIPFPYKGKVIISGSSPRSIHWSDGYFGKYYLLHIGSESIVRISTSTAYFGIVENDINGKLISKSNSRVRVAPGIYFLEVVGYGEREFSLEITLE